MHCHCNLMLGDSVELLRDLPSGTYDACVTDPPYAEVSRAYGRLSEPEWHALMDAVVPEIRRVLKPTGSAVLILQPNSERVGRMRTWLYEFAAKWGREWNLVQDHYWWNHSTPPTVHCQRSHGLMRPSVKWCVWLGDPKCYRNQDAVLWEPSQSTVNADLEDRALRRHPSGMIMRSGRCAAASKERGGTTPFNLLPLAPGAGSSIHGARTPYRLAAWWIRYLCPEGGTVLDPFAGVGTIGRAARDLGRGYVGLEKMPEYHAIASAALGGDQ